MPVTTICQSVGILERLIFKVKKLLKDGNDLKVVRTGGPKAKKWTIAAIRRITADKQKDPRKSIRSMPPNITWL
jgi:hypothetical protein